MQSTGIAYLTHTWNPIVMRCEPISEAFKHCWHLEVADRHSRNHQLPAFRRIAAAGRSAPILLNGDHDRGEELSKPSRRKKPARIGVEFMGDLWHHGIPDDWIDLVVAEVRSAPQHQFFFLTKRIDRARSYWRTRSVPPNALMGTTVENQVRADERLPHLCAIDARRWLSVEPLIAPVDLCRAIGTAGMYCIELVVAGCEKPPYRKTDDDWFRVLRRQCADAGVQFFLKQAVREGGAVITKPLLDGQQHLDLPAIAMTYGSV